MAEDLENRPDCEGAVVSFTLCSQAKKNYIPDLRIRSEFQALAELSLSGSKHRLALSRRSSARSVYKPLSCLSVTTLFSLFCFELPSSLSRGTQSGSKIGSFERRQGVRLHRFVCLMLVRLQFLVVALMGKKCFYSFT